MRHLMRLVENNSTRRDDENMITMDVFLIGLMIVSTMTGLVTEAIKKIVAESNAECRPNTVSGIVAAILSAGVGIGYVVFTGISFNAQIIICIVALMFMSWLCAMVGYDKVVQIFKNNTNKKG